jgi:riboflavin kinase/FMN adenylyltransferase
MLFDGEVSIVKEVSIQGIPIHSRTIKDYLSEGNIAMANVLLGREYQIEGTVITGQGIGKRSLVPTINLQVSEFKLPLEGVYATRTRIDGYWFDSVSFLGHRVTTDGSFAVETHILDEDISQVEGTVQLQFIASIRENKKFETLDALYKQIREDIDKTKLVLAKQTDQMT